MTEQKKWFEFPVLVLCEGTDFMHLIRSQYSIHSQDKVFIQDYKQNHEGELNSGDELTRWLVNVFDDPAPEKRKTKAIGIVADAEDSLDSAFQSARGVLKKLGFPEPTQNLEIASSDSMRAGVCIVPSDREAGCLEHMLLACKSDKIDFNDPCVEEFADCVLSKYREKNGKNPKSTDFGLDRWKAKLKVHASIAASDKPDVKLGQSAMRGYWDFSKENT